jgi:hypothetical protein
VFQKLAFSPDIDPIHAYLLGTALYITHRVAVCDAYNSPGVDLAGVG